jgi:hypothetical protein
MTTYEYFWQGYWIRCFDLASPFLFNENVNVRITNEDSTMFRRDYYLGEKKHRLDGPSIEMISKLSYSENSNSRYNRPKLFICWFVYGKELCDFHPYFMRNNFSESLFDYVKKWPENISQVIILARHNSWLNEKEIELLACMSMFI